MVANIHREQGIKYWCPSCAETFNKTDKNGVAVCDKCGGKRNDGLNQISEHHLQCIVCGCKFFKDVFKSGPACPNGCKMKFGK